MYFIEKHSKTIIISKTVLAADAYTWDYNWDCLKKR